MKTIILFFMSLIVGFAHGEKCQNSFLPPASEPPQESRLNAPAQKDAQQQPGGQSRKDFTLNDRQQMIFLELKVNPEALQLLLRLFREAGPEKAQQHLQDLQFIDTQMKTVEVMFPQSNQDINWPQMRKELYDTARHIGQQLIQPEAAITDIKKMNNVIDINYYTNMIDAFMEVDLLTNRPKDDIVQFHSQLERIKNLLEQEDHSLLNWNVLHSQMTITQARLTQIIFYKKLTRNNKKLKPKIKYILDNLPDQNGAFNQPLNPAAAAPKPPPAAPNQNGGPHNPIMQQNPQLQKKPWRHKLRELISKLFS